MTWAWDHPSGTYKNHALSSNIRMDALARTFFPRFMRPERGYGKGKGETITITRILQLSRARRVSELEGIPVQQPDISTVSATVALWATKIEHTEMERDLTHFNLQNQHQQLLRNNIRLTLDALGAETYTSTPYKFIPTTGGGVFDTDGTPSTQSTSAMNVSMLRKISDDLTSRKVPPFANGRYVGVFTTKSARGIRSDPEVKDWLGSSAIAAAIYQRSGLPGGSGGVPTGMTPLAEFIGTVDNVDVYQTNNVDVLRDGVGLNSVCGEGVVFGDDAAFLAQAMAPEIRAGLSTELGTKREVGWVGLLEGGLVWSDATRARAIHVTSS